MSTEPQVIWDATPAHQQVQWDTPEQKDDYSGPEYLRNAKPSGLRNSRTGMPMAEFQPSTDAARQAEEEHQRNLSSIATTGKEIPGSATKSSVLRNVSGLSGLAEGAFSPTGAAIAAAQTNPFTAVPVDAALIGHGLYRFGSNVGDAVSGNPNAAEESLGGLAEATGGYAGYRGAPSLRSAVSRAAYTTGGDLSPLAKSAFHPSQIPEQIFRSAFSPETPPTYPGASLPAAEDFYNAKGTDIIKRGVQEDALARRAAREAKANAPKPELGSPENPGWMSQIPKRMPKPATPESSLIVSPEASPRIGEPSFGGSEGRAATWTNQDVMRLAQQGNREAIQQAVRRGFTLPENSRYIMGDADVSRGVYNPRETTTFTPEGTPIRNKANPLFQSPSAKGRIALTDPFSSEAIVPTGSIPQGNPSPFSPNPIEGFKGGINTQGLEASTKPISSSRMIDSLSSEIDTMKTKLRNSGAASSAEKGALQNQINDYQAHLDAIRRSGIQ